MSKTYKGLTTNGVTELTLQEEGVGNIGTQTIVWDGATNGVIDQVQGDIPDSWKLIGNTLKQLQIGTSCTSIGSSAFSYCSGLTGSLTIPDSVESIGNDAFYMGFGGDSWSGSLTIGNSVTSIGSGAFYRCGGFTGSLTIGNSVTSIGSGAFLYCTGLTGSLVIPDSVTSIGSSAFYFCGFTGSLVIPDSVTSIGSNAFGNCSSITALYTNTPAASWVGTNALENTTALVNIYEGPDVIGQYSATFQGGSGMTVSAWTNYPNIP